MIRALFTAVLLVSQASGADTVYWSPTTLTTANTSKTGTSGAVAQINLGSGTNYVDRLVFRAIGSNTATVGRVFLNNGKDPTVAANNVLFAEITLDSTTLSEVAALADEELALNIWLSEGYRILVTNGTAVAAGWRVSAVCKTPTEVLE